MTSHRQERILMCSHADHGFAKPIGLFQHCSTIRWSAILVLFTCVEPLMAATWSVPIPGNAFRTESGPGQMSDRETQFPAGDSDTTYSVFFRIDRPAKLKLSIDGQSTQGLGQIRAAVGDTHWKASLSAGPAQTVALGEVEILQAGYVRVDLSRIDDQATGGVALQVLHVSSSEPQLTVGYVRDNGSNMFYWGRRGPSVHLNYQLPRGIIVSHAYCEITVPEGQDQIGSFFMANGFTHGYFGFQVNSDSERRVLFSIWSPYPTDNPAEIPEKDRVAALAKGERVTVRDFGNEGSGGQSFLVYPWKAGKTYRFLTEVHPNGDGTTRFTSWFGEKGSDRLHLIASFRRPKTNRYLTGFHSFLENFSPQRGHLQRSARYGNQWVRDTAGEWHELTQARFTIDRTGQRGYRLDYAGGVNGNAFFLKNCGFFAQNVEYGERLQRESDGKGPPSIRLEELQQELSSLMKTSEK